MYRKVTDEEAAHARATFADASPESKPRLFAIIEAHRLGRAHPDEPGEEDRQQQRLRRKKEKAARERAERVARRMNRYRRYSKDTTKGVDDD